MLSYKSIIEKGRRQYGVVFNIQLIFSAFEIKFKPQTSYEIDLPSLSKVLINLRIYFSATFNCLGSLNSAGFKQESAVMCSGLCFRYF